jgi:predicted RNase H-like HicB family nuclease
MEKNIEEHVGKIKVILEKSKTGYSAYAPDVSDIFTAAETFDEIRENIDEVIDAKIEYLREINKIKEAEELRNCSVEYYLDVRQFFEEFSMINKSEFANYIGMNQSLLRKISKGIISLSDQKARQIESGLHRLANDLSAVRFV